MEDVKDSIRITTQPFIRRLGRNRTLQYGSNTYKTDGDAKWDKTKPLYWSFDWNSAPDSFKDSARKFVREELRNSGQKVFVEMEDTLAEATMYMLTQHLFCVWSQHTGLDIRQMQVLKNKNRMQLMQISFQNKRHSVAKNDHQFDGDGGVMAHAFAPPLMNRRRRRSRVELVGDIHLDSSEKWSMYFNSEHFFGYALLHEIGHSLGLQHDTNQRAIMYNKFTSQKTRDERGPSSASVKIGSVFESDIYRIQDLYGKRNGTLTRKSCESGLWKRRTAPNANDIRSGKDGSSSESCSDGIISAIICVIRMVFRYFTGK